MGQHPTSTACIQPFKTDGTAVLPNNALIRGSVLLVAGTTYYFPLGGKDCPVQSANAWWDAAIIITSMTIEDCNFPDEVLKYAAGAPWVPETPTTAYVGTNGAAGVSATNGVVAATGGAIGAAMWHLGDDGAKRTRVKVVVGATGGEMAMAAWGKQ